MANPNNREYTNNEITVFWRPSECIHSTICFMRLRTVFNPSKRPWVNMEGASTEEIIKVVDQCPTNALTYKWNKDLDNENTGHETSSEKPDNFLDITIAKNGPLICKGSYSISDNEGRKFRSSGITALCRCAHSKHQPYCDGAHAQTGFSEKR
ncbi:MAG: (4Fe-4S)-binding protein [Bacteroidales bacterium]|nr:(4Fe-4S)-binding protein [Bacteroidales bacterium]